MLTMEDGRPRWTGYSTQSDSMHWTDLLYTNKNRQTYREYLLLAASCLLHTDQSFKKFWVLHHSRHSEWARWSWMFAAPFLFLFVCLFFLNTSTIFVKRGFSASSRHRRFLFVCCPCDALCLFCVYKRENCPHVLVKMFMCPRLLHVCWEMLPIAALAGNTQFGQNSAMKMHLPVDKCSHKLSQTCCPPVVLVLHFDSIPYFGSAWYSFILSFLFYHH